MKKIILLAIAFVAISFASCKKDRVCTCETTSASGTDKSVTTMYKVTKKEARANCIGNQTVYTSTSGQSTTGDKTTCTLK